MAQLGHKRDETGVSCLSVKGEPVSHRLWEIVYLQVRKTVLQSGMGTVGKSPGCKESIPQMRQSCGDHVTFQEAVGILGGLALEDCQKY